MLEMTTQQKIMMNPALGVMPLFVFSILFLLVDTRVAVSVALLLSIHPVRGEAADSPDTRHLLVTFVVAPSRFCLLFTSLPLLNRLVIVEAIFVLLLVVARLSRGGPRSCSATRDLTLKNGLKGAFRALPPATVYCYICFCCSVSSCLMLKDHCSLYRFRGNRLSGCLAVGYPP